MPLADPRLQRLAALMMLRAPHSDAPQRLQREVVPPDTLMQLLNPGQRNRLRDRIATHEDVMARNQEQNLQAKPPPYRIDDQGNVLAATPGEALAQDQDALRREGVRRMMMGDTPVPQVPLTIEDVIGRAAPEKIRPLPKPQPVPLTQTPLPRPRPPDAPAPYYDDD